MPDFSDCSDSEGRRLEELLSALRAPCEMWANPDSQFSDIFFEEFSSRLRCQHVFLKHPMMQESFDSAFIESNRVAGKKVASADAGQRFWDVEVENNRISLKTTQAKGLKDESLHISKLTEAAWIQDCRTAKARKEQTSRLFEAYIQDVDSIFQFRFFRQRSLYELVEIPVRLMKPVLDVPLKYFSTDGPSISIPIGEEFPDFTLKLDRSDAKITIANIRKASCVIHATWKF